MTIVLTGLEAVHLDLGHIHRLFNDHLITQWHALTAICHGGGVGALHGRNDFDRICAVLVVDNAAWNIQFGVFVHDLYLELCFASIACIHIEMGGHIGTHARL